MLGPTGRTADGPSRQKRFLLGVAVDISPQACPAPSFRAIGEVCSQRVAFGIAANRQKVCVILNHKRLEAALNRWPIPALWRWACQRGRFYDPIGGQSQGFYNRTNDYRLKRFTFQNKPTDRYHRAAYPLEEPELREIMLRAVLLRAVQLAILESCFHNLSRLGA